MGSGTPMPVALRTGESMGMRIRLPMPPMFEFLNPQPRTPQPFYAGIFTIVGSGQFSSLMLRVHTLR